ncbi:MAG: acyl-CoA thioesterase/bile acid-CoA:amino acid N-acyltransferase family protein [Pseudomonadota bacterium]
MKHQQDRYRKSLLAIVMSLAFTAPAYSTEPAKLLLEATERYSTEPLGLTVEGAMPGGLVVINCTLTDHEDRLWSSRGVYFADAQGRVNVAQAHSTAGTYTGVDPDGLVWSMLPIELGKEVLQADRRDVAADLPDRPYPDADFSYELRFSATLRADTRSGEKVTLEAQQRLRLDNPTIVRTDIAEAGVHGVLYEPAGEGPFPTVVWLSGSGGGASEGRAALLATNGFAALALATHNFDGRPDELDRVPLEYISNAITFAGGLHEQDSVGLGGSSRGAEMALLVASVFPERIGAVAATAPTNVLWGGCCSENTDVAYTLAGADLPAAEIYEHPAAQIETVIHGDAPASMRERFLAGMVSGKPAIRVEAIRAPILLLAGDADPIWPAALAVEMLTARLATRGSGPPVQSHIYHGAGHEIGSGYPFWAMRSIGSASPHPVDGALVPKGGTPSGNAHAARDGAKRIVEFFRAFLSD